MSGQQDARKRPLGDSIKLAWAAVKMNVGCMSTLSIIVCAAGFLMALWPNLISTFYARFTDAIQALFTAETSFSGAALLLSLLIAAYLFQAAYDYVQDICRTRDKQAITKHMKASIMECAGKVQFRYINNDADFRDKMAFTEMFGATEVATSVQQVLISLQLLFSVVSMSLLLWRVNPWIVVVLLAATIPSVIITATQKDEDYKNKTKNMKNSAMSVHLFYMAAGANEHNKSLLDLRFNNLYPWIKERWRQVSRLYLDEKQALTKKFLLLNMLADILRNGVYIGILLLVAGNIFQNPLLGLGTFTLVLTLSQQLQNRLGRLLSSTLAFFASINYMEDYQDLLATPREKIASAEQEAANVEIVYDHVSFAYPGSDRQALRDVSVRIRPGEKIAIVGENGSGKSTFVNLLCGLYEPTEGSVKLGGGEITESAEQVRKALAFVPQNFGRYEATIRENITITEPGRTMPEHELEAIAKSVGAMDFIRDQPNGMDEVIGTFSESGNNLSGGQWQKLALMRALYRKDASVIILDEPTAALDPQAEASLYRSFRDLTGDRTTLLISHRLGICTTVDRILVFEDGGLVEDGTHAQLMQNGGTYAKLYGAQARWYQ